MEGIVMRSTGSWYDVFTEEGKHIPSRLPGKHRLSDSNETNPVAVGDRVRLEPDGSNGIIAEILPRRNHIIRKSSRKTAHNHVLAANVDQVLLVATLKQPRTSCGFIDRFLVTAESFRIPQVIFFNKSDLLNEEETSQIEALRLLYQAIGVTVVSGSALSESSNNTLLQLLTGKTTLTAGHSGVGKSTLLNSLAPHIQQDVNKISDFTNKGTHTTTFAEMFALNPTTFIIDTPGVKEWGPADMTPEEISDYFPEMRSLRLDCKFGSRCIHLKEPGCVVRQAVNNGQVATSRYASYVSLATGEDTRL